MGNLGERIRALREAHSLSYDRLGGICGVSAQAVQQWENGATKNLRLEPFLRLCAYFHLDPYDLVFADSPDRPPSSPVDSTGRFRRRNVPK